MAYQRANNLKIRGTAVAFPHRRGQTDLAGDHHRGGYRSLRETIHAAITEEIMLVLTRKKTESIKIGNDIVITVIQTGKGTVRLGIEAPAHVRVLRGELAPHPMAPADTGLETEDDEEAVMDRFLTELNQLFGSTDTNDHPVRIPLLAEAALG